MSAEPATPIDKSTWPPGPWMNEPDRRVWKDQATGLTCMIIRSCFGHLCGYVGVHKTHPCHGKGCDEIDFFVHGGLTYASGCAGDICHTPEPGEPDDIWWLGFDCAHWHDYSPWLRADPEMGFLVKIQRETYYRTFDFVTKECLSLAKQLSDTANALHPVAGQEAIMA